MKTKATKKTTKTKKEVKGKKNEFCEAKEKTKAFSHQSM
jgi:hypothetical protein